MAKKSIFDKSALVVVGALCSIALLAIIVQAAIPESGCNEVVKINVSPKKTVQNSALVFSSDNDANSWDWDFGDGSPHSFAPKANHIYKDSKKYTVRLKINGKCGGELKLNVTQDLSLLDMPVIEGPSTAMIGAPVKFKETSGKAKSWEWNFQETGGATDATDQQPTYTFKTAGKKIIEVRADGDKNRVGYLDIDVKDPSGRSGGDAGGTGGVGGVPANGMLNEVQFIALLNDIAQRKKVVAVFSKSVCGHLNMVITVNGKPTTLDAFCELIKGNSRETVIDNLTLKKDPQNKCIVDAQINYHKGRMWGWRK